MKRSLGLLFDSVNDNTGDKAMGVVFKQLFSQYDNIKVQVIDPLNIDTTKYDSIIVGGGQLLRASGDKYYDNFRLPGSHILNSIGLLPPIDNLEFLNNYQFISARSSAEVKLLQSQLGSKKVKLLPCMTTLIKSRKYKIPGARAGEPLIGIHLVPETLRHYPEIVELINQLPYRKVIIPFTHYNHDLSFMKSLPFNWQDCIVLDELGVEDLHSVLGQTKFNIVSSLHATIFSYAQNVPFATFGQTKTVDYLRDRGLDNLAFTTSQQLETIIAKIDQNSVDMSQQIQQDQQLLKQTFDQYLSIIRSSKSEPKNQATKSAFKTSQPVHDIVTDSVIAGRDQLIAGQLAHQQYLSDQVTQKQAELDHLTSQISQLQGSLDSLIASRPYKLGWHLTHPWGSLKSLNNKASKYLAEKRLNYTPVNQLIDSHVVKRIGSRKKTSNLAVVVHVYYTDMWPGIAKQLKRLDKAKINYDLYISLPVESKAFASSIKKYNPQARVYIMPNHGRDILPFVIIAKHLIDSNYQSVLKLHTKRSLHWHGGQDWFNSMLSDLLPSKPKALQTIIAKLGRPKTGLIGPEGYYYSLKVNFAANGRLLQHLTKRLYRRSTARRHLHLKRHQHGFFAGSMFWARLDAIEPLINKAITTEYQVEAGQIDGTTAHAVERLLSLVPQINLRRIYIIKDGQVVRKSDYKGIVPDWSKD